MATTHYSEIKVYALSTDGVENACCEFDVESLRPTYKLLIGVPGKSNAFAISSKLGLPKYIIEDATTRIGAQDIQFEDLMATLEHNRVTIEKERNEISQYKNEVELLKNELEVKTEQLEARRDKIIRRANEEAADILRNAKEYADHTIKAMNKHGLTMKELEQERSNIRKKMGDAESKLALKAKKAEVRKQYKPSEFTLGVKVKVLSMNLIGTVSSKPNAKGDLFVQMGILRSQVNISDLEIIQEDAFGKKVTKSTGAGKIKMSKSSSISPEINLLGLTVDEAIAKLDKYLDDAYLALPQVRVVHGKGTGALRSGITSYLKRVPYVKSFRLGEIGEGDTGVTFVEFK
jgi:DNA mismatch repair protein MutS2